MQICCSKCVRLYYHWTITRIDATLRGEPTLFICDSDLRVGLRDGWIVEIDFSFYW